MVIYDVVSSSPGSSDADPFLGLLDPDPDPLVRGLDPDPSIIKEK
jgi:hypothetical protein